jgi:hypothetical protein
MADQNKRSNYLVEYEKEKRKRATQKDNTFILSGHWKKYIRDEDGFKVFAVDGEWVRNNLGIIFGAGGHGCVHEFIPLNEIWISTHHYDGCGCDNLKSKDQEVSNQYFESTVIHEITEFREMVAGMTFWEAHEIALEKEREIGILKDPHTEVD